MQRIWKPEQASARSGFLVLVACDDAPPDIASGGCSGIPTKCHIPAHSRTTVIADLRHHAVCLTKRRGRHCLGRSCNRQSRCNSDQPKYCHVSLLFEAEASQQCWGVGRWMRLRCREGRPAPSGPHLQLEGAPLEAMCPPLQANGSPYKELVKNCSPGPIMRNPL